MREGSAGFGSGSSAFWGAAIFPPVSGERKFRRRFLRGHGRLEDVDDQAVRPVRRSLQRKDLPARGLVEEKSHPRPLPRVQHDLADYPVLDENFTESLREEKVWQVHDQDGSAGGGLDLVGRGGVEVQDHPGKFRGRPLADLQQPGSGPPLPDCRQDGEEEKDGNKKALSHPTTSEAKTS